MRHKFAEIDASPSLGNYADLAIRRIQSRARNQAVNAMIQGSCATLAKQSILNLIPMLEAAGLADKVRFMRSEERRVGKEVVSTCISRCSPNPYTKKQHIIKS